MSDEPKKSPAAFLEQFNAGVALIRKVLGVKFADAVEKRHAESEEVESSRIRVMTALSWGYFFQRPGLSLRDRALVLIGSDVAQKSWPAFADHIRLAKYAGVSDTELREAVAQLSIYCGFPTVREASEVLDSVLTKGNE